MKAQNISPKFLISRRETNPIIRTKFIISIKYNDFNNIDIVCPDKTIEFKLKNNEILYWNSETICEAIAEYNLIIESLKKIMIDY